MSNGGVRSYRIVVDTTTGYFAATDGSGVRVHAVQEDDLPASKTLTIWSCVGAHDAKPGGDIVELECGLTGLTRLELLSLPWLKRLSCDHNLLAALDVSSCIALEDLSCGMNRLESLNLSGCRSLRSLHCRQNRLKTLDVKGLASLRELACGGNRFRQSAKSLLGLAGRPLPSTVVPRADGPEAFGRGN